VTGARFPDGFLWGAATSAYQIEGSPLADGAGASIWHRFSHTPGKVFGGQTGDVACDHYRRWREDVALMRDLGLTAYRFSIAWGRVLPEGRGRLNPAGIDFYARLVDALLEAGITPMVTLYHWDLPATLDDLGGWVNPDVAHWFADYAAVAFEALGDRVPLWATLNEPWVVMDGGYLFGVMAPGHASLEAAPVVTHNLLRAHGAAVRAFRASCPQKIGIVLNIEPKEPASDSPADVAAAARAGAYMNRQYIEPVFRGRYPEELCEVFGEAWPDFQARDFDLIREPVDFLGINYYTRRIVANDDAHPPVRVRGVPVPDATYTETHWEVFPPGLTRTLHWVKAYTGDLPLYVTENGAAFPDPDSPVDGVVDDPARVSYLRGHLAAARRAIAEGVNLRGYFAWSLLDNFEWQSGFSKRFGLVHVDYATLARTPKSSAAFYREVIASHGAAV
jgi:beta-glucosidase